MVTTNCIGRLQRQFRETSMSRCINISDCNSLATEIQLEAYGNINKKRSCR